jgi:hypothetical protein
MPELTLETLAQRVEALERALRLQLPCPGKDAWQDVVGMFAGSDFMRQVDAEGRKIREAERAQAQQEPAAE